MTIQQNIIDAIRTKLREILVKSNWLYSKQNLWDGTDEKAVSFRATLPKEIILTIEEAKKNKKADEELGSCIASVWREALID